MQWQYEFQFVVCALGAVRHVTEEKDIYKVGGVRKKIIKGRIDLEDSL